VTSKMVKTKKSPAFWADLVILVAKLPLQSKILRTPCPAFSISQLTAAEDSTLKLNEVVTSEIKLK